MDRSMWSLALYVLLNRSCLLLAIERPERLLSEVGGATRKGNPDSLPVGLVHVELVKLAE